MQYRMLLAAASVLAACQGAEPVPTAPTQSTESAAVAANLHHGPYHPSHERLPIDQLARVKLATARYRSLQNALDDGYADINVVIPNMGRHFLKQGILDAKFEVERPELLVYSEGKNGRMELVAVEYAVPLSLAASAPEGFRGGADEWSVNQQFQLWTLHAWVWKENPDGVFNPTNRRVP